MKYLAPFVILIISISNVFAQSNKIDGWINLLKAESNKQVLMAASVEDSIGKYDTITIVKYISELETASANKSKRLQARVIALKARLLFYKLGPGDSLYAAEMKNALDLAYQLDDSYMIAEYSRWYAEMQNTLGNQLVAAQLCLNAVRMQEELGLQYFPTVQNLYFGTGDILYSGCNLNIAVSFFKEGIFTLVQKLQTTELVQAPSTA